VTEVLRGRLAHASISTTTASVIRLGPSSDGAIEQIAVDQISGGYSRAEADERLALNHGVIASFSRALTEGLNVEQSDQEFDSVLDTAIGDIYTASST
jgi:fructose-bisphosphate aldolase class 1